jgi:isoquinoline 1-oxidoreductase beta subunit
VPAKSNGTAQFTLDIQRPGMLTAVVRRPPRFGGKVRSFDASEALKVDGVVDVLEVPSGVAVFAKGFWPARQGRAKLRVEWDESDAETRGSEQLLAEYRALLDQPGTVARGDGEAEQALAGAARTFEADYEFPYLAHAPMEPLDAVIELRGDGCEMWAGSQLQTLDHGSVAGITGLPPEKAQVHTLMAGGSFGRRATTDADIASEAAHLAVAWQKKHPGKAVPIKLVWPREDDIRGGKYRPMYVHRLRAGVDGDGRIVAWHHRIVGQSVIKGTAFEPALVQNGVDNTSVEGASTLPYTIPNLQVEITDAQVKVPVLWWRSVGHTHTAYSTETFLDDIARATDQDPVALRRQLLKGHPRHAGVLEAVAELSNWGSPLPAGRARGVAVHESFSSFVAQVVEVSEREDGLPKVEKVYCAVDCGVPINPDVIAAQMEGGIGFGLGAALYNAIHLDDGRVRESNFNNYRQMRLREMPAVETVVVPSAEAPTGVGEPGVPPIAPAVANAWAQLTGRPVRRLPFSLATEEV